VTIVLNI